MTREEANTIIRNVATYSFADAEKLIAMFEGLGMLTLEPPKTPSEALTGFLVFVQGYDSASQTGKLHDTSVSEILAHFDRCGLKIIRKYDEAQPSS